MKITSGAPIRGIYAKTLHYIQNLFKTILVVASLYLFIASLTFLSLSFRILGGPNLSTLFSSSHLLSNPIVGVMIGILVTVLVQSSSTSTSIIVSLVSAGVQVKHAIPMILGSNVGTSVTNTLVSMTQASDREVFKKAFAAATVHDMFNWLSVIVLMGVEIATGFLETLTDKIVGQMVLQNGTTSSSNIDILKPIIKPFTNAIVRVDKRVLIGWSVNDPAYANTSSILLKDCPNQNCNYLLAYMDFNGLELGDTFCGIFLLITSLLMLILCLFTIMKALNSMLGSSLAIFIQKVINAQVPYAPCLTGYLAMLIGAIITILVRSSSIFTSTLTPLCGLGLVTLETAYPMTLGSNIGTTTTSILASFAAEGRYLRPSVQIALVHLFFNIVGILMFYPVPCMRWPLPLARRLGDVTGEYRWFAGVYLIGMFVCLPGVVFVLSAFGGVLALYSVLFVLGGVGLGVGGLWMMQKWCVAWLPVVLRDWEWVPIYLRSLEPWDRIVRKCCVWGCCERFLGDEEQEKGEEDKHERIVMLESGGYNGQKRENEEVAILANSN